MTRERSQSLIASAALHAAVILATLVTWPWTRELKIGASVPINIVSNAPSTDLRPAIQDVQDQEAQNPEPAPEPTPEPPQPQPAPTPAPPPPTPQPKAPTPAPKAAKPTPKPPPPKPAPKKPQKSSNDFLDSLAADVAKLSKSSGAKGPARAETARQARPDLGSGLSANAVAGLAEELQRRWNPNCAVEGGADVKIPVTFTLGSGGRVVGEVTAAGLERSSDPVKRAAAERAIRAVYQSAPFTKLPRGFYGTPILVNFNAREACS